MSHAPAEALHSMPCATTVSAGQALVVPSHVSTISQGPTRALQVKVFGWTASAGQSLLTPSQDSATSQSPVDVLHTAVDLTSAGHVALEPLHVSATSQAPAEALHSVAADLKVQFVLQQAPLSHSSVPSTVLLPQVWVAAPIKRLPVDVA